MPGWLLAGGKARRECTVEKDARGDRSCATCHCFGRVGVILLHGGSPKAVGATFMTPSSQRSAAAYRYSLYRKGLRTGLSRTIRGTGCDTFLARSNLCKIVLNAFLLLPLVLSATITGRKAVHSGRSHLVQGKIVAHDLEWLLLAVGTTPMKIIERFKPLNQR